MDKKQVLKKAARIAGNVLLYLFIALCIFGVVLTLASKKEADGTATVFGMQMRTVVSPSMEKCEHTDVSGYEIQDIPVGNMVFIETVPEDEAEAMQWYADLKVGDVLTFKYLYLRQETITHRIIKIQPNATGNGYMIWLEGDNKNSESGVLTQVLDTSHKNTTNYVIGKVTGQSAFLGWLVSTLSSPLGMILIVIVPALALLIFELVRVFRILNADKKKKEEEEKAQNQAELEELRRRLAELEAQKGSSPEERGAEGNPQSEVKNGDEPQ